jgi:hypothetical protein
MFLIFHACLILVFRIRVQSIVFDLKVKSGKYWNINSFFNKLKFMILNIYNFLRKYLGTLACCYGMFIFFTDFYADFPLRPHTLLNRMLKHTYIEGEVNSMYSRLY